MSKLQFTNNASGKLNAGITDIATTLTLQAGQGALFPVTATGKYFKATLIKATGEIEVVKVTQRTGDVFDTMERAQEGTTNLAFSSGDRVELRPTRGVLEAFEQVAPPVIVAGNETLDYASFNTTRIYTAAAAVALPPASAVDIGDFVDFKSITHGHVRFTPDGADTIDGVAAAWSVPSFTDGRLVKATGGAWVLTRRPNVEIGMTEFWPSANATPPSGYIFADGQNINRATYGGLFFVYGTTHGAGDGSTTFGNVDLRGRAPFGRDDMGGVAASRVTSAGSGINGAAVGAAGGLQNEAIATAHLPASGLSIPGLSVPGLSIPSLSVSASGAVSGTIASKYKDDGGPIATGDGNFVAETSAIAAVQESTVNNFSLSANVSGSTGGGTTGGGTTGGGTTGNMGTGTAYKKMPPAIIGNWIVKT